jgi:hypothetical protein
MASGGLARKITPYSAPHPLVWQRNRKLLMPPISGRVGLPARQHPCHIKPEHAKMTAAAGKVATSRRWGEKPKRGITPPKDWGILSRPAAALCDASSRSSNVYGVIPVEHRPAGVQQLVRFLFRIECLPIQFEPSALSMLGGNYAESNRNFGRDCRRHVVLCPRGSSLQRRHRTRLNAQRRPSEI